MNLFWTPEKEKLLKAMWAEGKSSSEIGRKLGATRGAVMGKAHRLRLPLRKTAVTSTPKSKPLSPPPKTDRKQGGNAYQTVRDAMMGLKPEDCRWPSGAPHEDRLSFCGTPKLEDYPYCLKHCYSAYDNFEEAQEKKKAKKGKR